MKKYLCILSFISVLFVSCGESPEKYNKRAFAVADSIIKYTDAHFSFASDCQDCWRSLIFDYKFINPITGQSESFYGGHSEGIAKYKTVMSLLNTTKENRKKLVDSLYMTIKEAPEKSADNLKYIKELLTYFDRATEFAWNPTGSLQSYTNEINEAFSKYKELKSKIELEKK